LADRRARRLTGVEAAGEVALPGPVASLGMTRKELREFLLECNEFADVAVARNQQSRNLIEDELAGI
jgi:hypothetical protein